MTRGRIVVCGSRTIRDPIPVVQAIEDSGFTIETLLTGRARGVDEIAEAWARARRIAVEPWPADWRKYGNFAGPRRNTAMIATADGLIAVWNGVSAGTSHAIATANLRKIPVFLLRT